MIYALIVGPLGFLRGPLVLERAFWYLWVLIPQGLLTRAMRIAIDWRLGHFDVAIVQAEALITQLEQAYRKRPNAKLRRHVLLDLFSILARAYLHTGHIDEAMQVVIRSNKSLGVDRLIGLAELDAKTAHLVRAGLAAGRLLDGGGLATMFVKSPPKNSDQEITPEHERNKSVPRSKVKHAGKVIPFPKGQDPATPLS